MKTQNMLRAFVLLFVSAACLSSLAVAQSASKVESVAAIAADRAEVRWQPQIEYGRMVLTVSTPDGQVFRKEFDSGVAPSFQLVDREGNGLPDGSYQYELRVIPNLSLEVRKALAASREKGDGAELVQDLQRKGQLPASITVQSGAFSIDKGHVLTGSPENGVEPQGSKRSSDGAGVQSKKKSGGEVGILDVVTPDDIIVQGSACIGLDCVNGEVFGFDTIRMKENNTRVKFEDTSAAGFPSTDWQLTANDSAAGGANRFSIEDITSARIPFTVTGGAPTNSFFVASNGKVGLRTSTPVLDLHINTSDTPAHRLEQNAAGGFAAQTWDIAGNEANFFVRDVTGGSRLPFRIRPGAPTSSLDIAADGDVGIGTQAPSGALHIANNSSQWSSSNYGTNMIVKDGTTARNPAIGIFDSTHANPWAIVNTAGTLRFSQMPALGNVATAPIDKMVINTIGNVGIGTTVPAGTLDVNGTIFQRGILLHADYVFEPTYNLESIEDHAAFMWDNKHLPALGARTVDEKGREVVEIGARMRGMLEELEKAHIYISTLSERINEKDASLVKLERQNAELAERLARIEALLSASKSEKK